MFSLCDLRFVLCSLDVDVLCVQRIIGFLNLNNYMHPQINEVEITWSVLHTTLFTNWRREVTRV